MKSLLIIVIFFSLARQPLEGKALLIFEVPPSLSDTADLLGLFWTSDGHDLEKST
jgi:hypothetical protein